MSGRMVVGFLFAEGCVLLQQKSKPDWMSGLWNGIGGKVDFNESADNAMVRECLEETGCAGGLWQHFCTEMGEGYQLYCYKILRPLQPAVPPVNDAGEPQAWVPLCDLANYDLVGNLSWLLPLALDWRDIHPMVADTRKHISARPTWRPW